ncbi:hypothetical protein BC940DRAFT_310187 [Gongronella butleri]|nr:hypothetical protein BC940DRAFT_310187 [Gongronella butleri]
MWESSNTRSTIEIVAVDHALEDPPALVAMPEPLPGAVMPLGKALSLLLHVKAHVLARANDARHAPDSAPSDDPVLGALESIDHYLDQRSDCASVRHVYDPLKDKVLKKDAAALRLLKLLVLHSRHRDRYRQLMGNVLVEGPTKRDQLAVALILNAIVCDWPSLLQPVTLSAEIHAQCTDILQLAAPLCQMLQNVGDQPTMLACTAVDTYLVMAAMGTMLPLVSPVSSSGASSSGLIAVVATPMATDLERQPIFDFWEQWLSVLAKIQKWKPQHAWSSLPWLELTQWLSVSRVAIEQDPNQYREVAMCFAWLSHGLASSWYLAKQPKRKKIFELESPWVDTPLARYCHLLLLALYSTEAVAEDDLLDWMENQSLEAPWQELGDFLVPLLISKEVDESVPARALPDAVYVSLLRYPWHAMDASLYPVCLDHLVFWCLPRKDHATAILLETAAAHNWRESDPSVTFVLDMLLRLNKNDKSAIYSVTIARAMLQGVATNQRCCEIYIECLPQLHLSSFLLPLIQLVATSDTERGNQVGKGLIAKMLLCDSTGDLALLYCDLIRDFVQTRRFCVLFDCMHVSKQASPKDIAPLASSRCPDSVDLDLQKTALDLLGAVQLWSTRAPDGALAHVAALLVLKSANAPSDTFFLWVWQSVAMSIMAKHEAMRAVLQHCTDLMTRQQTILQWLQDDPNAATESNAWMYTLLLPILILMVFPKQAFSAVALACDAVQKRQARWPPMQGTFKTESNPVDASLYLALADELLDRCSVLDHFAGAGSILRLVHELIARLFYA